MTHENVLAELSHPDQPRARARAKKISPTALTWGTWLARANDGNQREALCLRRCAFCARTGIDDDFGAAA